jgi:hypothetical protein
LIFLNFGLFCRCCWRYSIGSLRNLYNQNKAQLGSVDFDKTRVEFFCLNKYTISSRDYNRNLFIAMSFKNNWCILVWHPAKANTVFSKASPVTGVTSMRWSFLCPQKALPEFTPSSRSTTTSSWDPPTSDR